MMAIKGTLFLYSETGTEGGYWAIQDENFIKPPSDDWPHEQWSYDGLFCLEDGDRLKIFNPDGTIRWEGEIELKHRKGEKLAGQVGVSPHDWAVPFFKEYHGELTKKAK
jgi:hypothetical protein